MIFSLESNDRKRLKKYGSRGESLTEIFFGERNGINVWNDG